MAELSGIVAKKISTQSVLPSARRKTIYFTPQDFSNDPTLFDLNRIEIS